MRSDLRPPENDNSPFVSPAPTSLQSSPGSEVLAGARAEAYLRGMQHLVTVVQRLSQARSLDAITSIVRRAARELTDADGATFVLRDQNLCYYADEDAISPLWKGQRFPMSACISGWAMLHKETVIIEDVREDVAVRRHEGKLYGSLCRRSASHFAWCRCAQSSRTSPTVIARNA